MMCWHRLILTYLHSAEVLVLLITFVSHDGIQKFVVKGDRETKTRLGKVQRLIRYSTIL